jgi:hypothetical protein
MPCHACPDAIECQLCEACADHCDSAAPNDFDRHLADLTAVYARVRPGALAWLELSKRTDEPN